MSSYINITHSTKTMLMSFWSFWMYLSFEPKSFWLLLSADSQFNKIERSRTYGLPCKSKDNVRTTPLWEKVFEFAALLCASCRQAKKRGKLRTNLFFVKAELLLYCLFSKIEGMVRTTEICMIFTVATKFAFFFF